MNGEADCPTDLEMAAPKGQGRSEPQFPASFSPWPSRQPVGHHHHPPNSRPCLQTVQPTIEVGQVGRKC